MNIEKRITLMLLFTSIACVGCYDVEIDKLTGLPVSDKVTEVAKQNKIPIKAIQTRGPRGWIDEWDLITQLGFRIVALEEGLSEVKAEPMLIEALLVRISDLESSLETQRAFDKEERTLLVRISDLESALDSQRAEIEASKNVLRLYEVAVESQKLTIEILQKLCRLYESSAGVNSGGP